MSTFTDIVQNAFNRGVTYRRYGKNGEHQRAITHRWHYTKIKGAKPAIAVMVDNLTACNSLLKRLSARK